MANIHRSMLFLTAILLLIATMSFAKLESQPNMQQPQAFIQQASQPIGTKPLPVMDALPTFIPEQQVATESGSAGLGTSWTPTARMAVLVGVAGVVFGLGMGV
ncbi:hypothetical protein K491DRAFT_310264 [Lophiostoma macrostomum CBS 122681]|uniref:Transmembrane protein n=1 Tax=Lophiostoma macrostomum CBS 122681 TaxID=1314788 RepID=A0A6A6SJ40_9PLEO|nr:hypothetical protein K491DRAFT_310264 [Lophiostoma macrostomum CBS 122681]